MRKYLMVAAALMVTVAAHSKIVKADAINNLTISKITAPDEVPQSKSNPCIICATNSASQPDGFGYNNFNSTGNDLSFNLFSSNITGSFANDDQTTVTPYTAGQLRDLLSAVFPNVDVTFAIAVDINTTKANSEYLNFFQLIDLGEPGLGDETVIFDLRDVAMPQVNQGNGTADYLISGFDLSSLDADTRLLFRASWSGAVDGGESFYIVPQLVAVPGPMVGAGIPGLIAMCGGLVFLARRRRKLAA